MRLSEALARLCLEDEVKPDHVMEAFRLLKQSIVTVEANDVDLSEFVDKSSEVEIQKLREQQPEEEEAKTVEQDDYDEDDGNATTQEPTQDLSDDGDESAKSSKDESQTATATSTEASSDKAPTATDTTDTDAGVDSQGPSKPATKATSTITWEKYSEIKNSLALHLRQTEEAEGATGMSEHDLILWYLSEGPRSHLIESEEDLMAERQLVMSIIERLITKERSLIVVESERDEMDQEADHRVIAVHPNYVIDS